MGVSATRFLWAPLRRDLESALGSEEFQRAFEELKQTHEVFLRYPTVDALVALCRAGSPDLVGKDQALGAILRALKRDWKTLLPFVRLLFWESLVSLHANLARRERDPEDLMGRLDWLFESAVDRYNLARSPSHIDVNLVMNTRRELLRCQKKQARERKALRALARELPPEAALPEDPPVFPIAPEGLEEGLREMVALGLLAPVQLEVILETYLKGLTVAEWARRRGVEFSTAKTWRERGIKKARRHLGGSEKS